MHRVDVAWAFVKSSSWAEQQLGTYAIVREHTSELASSNGIFSRLLVVLEVLVRFH